MTRCPLHGIYCKRPRSVEGLIAFHRAHANIPLHYLDPTNEPAQDSRTVRWGKTRRDHSSGAWSRRLANRSRRGDLQRG